MIKLNKFVKQNVENKKNSLMKKFVCQTKTVLTTIIYEKWSNHRAKVGNITTI